MNFQYVDVLVVIFICYGLVTGQISAKMGLLSDIFQVTKQNLRFYDNLGSEITGQSSFVTSSRASNVKLFWKRFLRSGM